MKVIVTRCDKNRIIKADMEREIERLFQENKDLRLSESHLRDELNLSQQQSEVRRQKMVEKDKEIEHMHTKIANVGAERDNFEASYKQVAQWWNAAQSKVIEIEAIADEYHVALMESDCRVDELEKQLEWARNKNEEWAQVAANLKEEKKALENIIYTFEETRKEYEEEIHAQHIEKREWMQKYEELKAQKEADDKKSEEICAACNEVFGNVLSERDYLLKEVARLTNELNNRNARVEELEKRIEWLQNERQLYENNVARLTNERDTAVNENTEMMFEINELQDKLEAEHDLRVEAEKEYDRVASEAYDMHKKIAELTIDNTRLENKVEELNELEADYDELAKTKREYGEEIDRLRKVVIELQTNRFTYDEFIGMIMKNFVPSTDK